MIKPITVRSIRREDFTAWLALWEGYNAFYGRSGETALGSEVTATTWERFFDPYEPLFALVAERDGKLIGLAHHLLHRSTTQTVSICYLQDLFTQEASRGQGVARLLISETFNKAKALNVTRVYWMTYKSNTTAMYLYDKMANKGDIVVYRKSL